MLTERAIYETLSRKDLQDLVAHFEITVADRRVRDNLVQAVVAARKVRLSDALARLPVASLKDICHKHALDDAGRQKAAIAERIAKAVKSKPAKAAKSAAKAAKPAAVKAAKAAKPAAKAAKPAKAVKAPKAAAKAPKPEKVAKPAAKVEAPKASKPVVAKAPKAAQAAKPAAAKAPKAPKAAKVAKPTKVAAAPSKDESPKTNLLARASALDAVRVINEATAVKPVAAVAVPAPAAPKPSMAKMEIKKSIALVPVPDAAPKSPAAVQAPAGAPPLNPTRVLDWPENLPTPPMQRSEVAAPVFAQRSTTEHCVACSQSIELRKCQVQRCNNHIMASPTYKICAECLFERNTLSMTDFNERLQEEGTCPHCGHAWKKAS